MLNNPIWLAALCSVMLWCLLPHRFSGSLFQYPLGLLFAFFAARWSCRPRVKRAWPLFRATLFWFFLSKGLWWLMPYFIQPPGLIDPTFLFLHAAGPLFLGSFLVKDKVIPWARTARISLAVAGAVLVGQHFYAVFQVPGGLLRLRPMEFTYAEDFQLVRRPFENLGRSLAATKQRAAGWLAVVLPVSISLRFFNEEVCEGIAHRIRSAQSDSNLPVVLRGYFDPGSKACSRLLLTAFGKTTHPEYLAMLESEKFRTLPKQEKYFLVSKVNWLDVPHASLNLVLTKGESIVKELALLALAGHTEKVLTFLPQILSIVTDGKESEPTRRAGLSAIGKLEEKGAEAVGTLASLLEHLTLGSLLADSTIATLGWIGPAAKEAIPALVRALEYEEVRKLAFRGRCGNENFARRRWDPVSFAFTRIGRAAIPALEAALRSSKPTTRLKIKKILTEIRAGRVATLTPFSKHANDGYDTGPSFDQCNPN